MSRKNKSELPVEVPAEVTPEAAQTPAESAPQSAESTLAEVAAAVAAPSKGKGGRPKGSKNKPKAAPAPVAPVIVFSNGILTSGDNTFSNVEWEFDGRNANACAIYAEEAQAEAEKYAALADAALQTAAQFRARAAALMTLPNPNALTLTEAAKTPALLEYLDTVRAR